jgi:flagellar assembly protein FliH
MNQATKFLFNQDFRDTGGDKKTREALAEAEKAAFARGLAQGRAEAEARTEARIADALGRLADHARRLLSETEGEKGRVEREAVELALAVAGKIAGEALAKQPLTTIEAAARQAFEHLRGVPHLAVRVNESLVEEVDSLMRKLSREKGFEGRVVVLGEPHIPPGDAKLEWADGGVIRDAQRISDDARRLAGGDVAGR